MKFCQENIMRKGNSSQNSWIGMTGKYFFLRSESLIDDFPRINGISK